MKGLYIIENKHLKKIGELKFGMTAISFKNRIKDYTYLKNPYYVADYGTILQHQM